MPGGHWAEVIGFGELCVIRVIRDLGFGGFPRYLVTLNNAYRSWFEGHFTKLRYVEVFFSKGCK